MAETTMLTINYLQQSIQLNVLTSDTKEKLRLNCGVTAELCHSALARSECDDWPIYTQTGYTLKP